MKTRQQLLDEGGHFWFAWRLTINLFEIYTEYAKGQGSTIYYRPDENKDEFIPISK